MKSRSGRRWAMALIRVAIALVFVAAGFVKIFGVGSTHPSGTIVSEMVGNSPWSIRSIGVIELVAGAWLISGRSLMAAALFSTVVCSAFFGVVLSEIRMPNPRPCGCFSLTAGKDAPSEVRQQLWISVGRTGVPSIGSLILLLNSGLKNARI